MADSNKRDEAWNYLGLDPQDINTRQQIDTPEFRSNPKLVECVEALGERANGTSWKPVWELFIFQMMSKSGTLSMKKASNTSVREKQLI